MSRQARAGYRKWVRFYPDFCRKYGHPPRRSESLGPFLQKLAAKGQPEASQKQAAAAVRLSVGGASARGSGGAAGGWRRAIGAGVGTAFMLPGRYPRAQAHFPANPPGQRIVAHWHRCRYNVG